MFIISNNMPPRKEGKTNDKQQQQQKQQKKKQQKQQQEAEGDNIQSPGSRTNKNGLPFEVQQAIVDSVLKGRGHNSFCRNVCDNPFLFGKRNTILRRRCTDRRQYLANLFENEPQQFLEVCQIYLPETTTTIHQEEEDREE
jgi:hypothetical protein